MIHNRLCWLGLMVALTAGLFAGCGKSDSQSSTSGSPVTPSSTLNAQPSPALRLHWLGKKQLAADPNATNFLAIWNLPESARLEAQTLDKLASAPWRFWQTNTPASNAPTALLRPLLDDLVQEESYLEVCVATNQPPELVLAVRLPADRAALWQTNLPRALHSLFGVSAATNSASPDFRYQLPSLNYQLSLTRSGAWTILSVSGSQPSTPNPQPSQLLNDFQQRLATNSAPYAARATNYIIETDGDLAQLNDAFRWRGSLPAAACAFRLVMFGDGESLRTRGWLDFAQPLNLPLDPWNVPSNQIYQPLVSFSAVRGIRPWLEGLSFWKQRELGVAPNQAFLWAQESAPWLHFFAASSPDANRQFLALKDFILETVNPALAPGRTGDFAWLTNEARVVWKGVPFCSPTFELRNDLILGGFSANSATNRATIPVELLQQLQNGTNLLYYDWEMTSSQVAAWTQIGQLMRMAFSRAQISIKDSGLPWLNAVGPNLGYCATTLTLEGDHRLVFARAATLGLTSFELELFVDWLDSPDFPHGLHTFQTPRELVSDRMRPSR